MNFWKNKPMRSKVYKKNISGQGTVEFALAFPILLVFLIGMFEMGRLLVIYTTTVSASRAASRYGTSIGDGTAGVAQYLDCGGMKQKAIDIGILSSMVESDIVISYLVPDNNGNFGVPVLCGNGSDELLRFGSRIQVVVTGHFQPINYFTNFFPDLDIVSVSRRTILKGIQFSD